METALRQEQSNAMTATMLTVMAAMPTALLATTIVVQYHRLTGIQSQLSAQPLVLLATTRTRLFSAVQLVCLAAPLALTLPTA